MNEKAKVKVVIDPGHGGSDPGAVNAKTGLREADVTLRIAHALKAIFDAHPEFEVALTREKNKTVSLKERTDLANELDASLVSIHCNAAPSPGAHGVETWCFAETDPDGSESSGHKLAKAIQNKIVALGLRDRGVKAIYDRQAGKYIFRKLWILRKTRRPAVIVECGFISNAKDAAKLGDDHNGFKEKVAAALFAGIKDALIAH
jgi:N-acetylmuramoyl-L-alanine amidase